MYADIGEFPPGSANQDTEMLATTRRNLPVTVQRRFDVYPDVSK